MTNYNVDLSPSAVNMGTEGSMDTAIVNGNSIQRTVNSIIIKNQEDYKFITNVADGGTFDNTIQTLGDLPNLTASEESESGWARPAQWLPLPEVQGQQKFAGLFAIYPDANFLAVSAEGNYTVNWGDGNVEDFDSGDTAYHEYTYGDISDLNEDVLGYRQVVVQIYPQAGQNLTALNIVEDHDQAGLNTNYIIPWLDIIINAENLSSLVCNQQNGMISCTILDNNIIDASYLFYGCKSLANISFNTSNVTNMAGMLGETSLGSISLSDTSNVTNMNEMFFGCYSLTSVPLFDTSNVTDMGNMFEECTALSSVPLFDTSNVTNMEYMFYFCTALSSVPLFDTSNVTNMGDMFYLSVHLSSVPLFDTSNVTDMGNMFRTCYSLTSVPLFNTASVTDMNSMFSYCSALPSVPLFDTSNVTNMGNMFVGCSSLTVGALNGTKVNISYANCKLSATQLNAIYTGLATVSGQTITVTGNYGTASDNPTIATDKGWTVTS